MADGKLTSGTEDHDWDVTRNRITFESAESISAIHDRHDVIEKDDARLFTLGDVEGLASINGTQHTTPERPHAQLSHPAHVRFVIDNEYGFIGEHELKFGVGVLKAGSFHEPE